MEGGGWVKAIKFGHIPMGMCGRKRERERETHTYTQKESEWRGEETLEEKGENQPERDFLWTTV